MTDLLETLRLLFDRVGWKWAIPSFAVGVAVAIGFLFPLVIRSLEEQLRLKEAELSLVNRELEIVRERVEDLERKLGGFQAAVGDDLSDSILITSVKQFLDCDSGDEGLRSVSFDELLGRRVEVDVVVPPQESWNEVGLSFSVSRRPFVGDLRIRMMSGGALRRLEGGRYYIFDCIVGDYCRNVEGAGLVGIELRRCEVVDEAPGEIQGDFGGNPVGSG